MHSETECGGEKLKSNDLLAKLDRIHTTDLGAERIRKNLCLNINDDIIDWCKLKISNSGDIIRKGKNWYAHCEDFTLTINANSFTVITAHKYKKRSKVD